MRIGATSTESVRIVHREEGFAVVEKPSGLLSCPGRAPELFDSVQTRIPAMLEASGPILVHRLDQWTSGLMVVALDAPTHRALRKQFEARSVGKEYEAELMGRVRGDGGMIALPFRLDVERRPLQIYDPAHGKWSVSSWRVKARTNARTRVEFQPLTGRTHQLRVHAAHPLGLGCSIAGDALYGQPTAAPRLLLHARRLEFDHPCTGERMRFESVVPF